MSGRYESADVPVSEMGPIPEALTRPGIGAPCGSPVTLEEMTRRRDGWRLRWDKTDRELRAALARERTLTREVDRMGNAARAVAAELYTARREAVAAQAQARRYAEECGRLRDRLAQAVGFIDE